VPDDLDPSVVEAIYALRPALAPPLGLDIADVLDALQEGPLVEPVVAAALEQWLAAGPGAAPPGVLPIGVVEATYALRPEMAPGPSLSIEDVLAGVTEGPLAVKSTQDIKLVEQTHAQAPSRWWGRPAVGLALMAAVAMLVVLPEADQVMVTPDPFMAEKAVNPRVGASADLDPVAEAVVEAVEDEQPPQATRPKATRSKATRSKATRSKAAPSKKATSQPKAPKIPVGVPTPGLSPPPAAPPVASARPEADEGARTPSHFGVQMARKRGSSIGRAGLARAPQGSAEGASDSASDSAERLGFIPMVAATKAFNARRYRRALSIIDRGLNTSSLKSADRILLLTLKISTLNALGRDDEAHATQALLRELQK
jgi:hypothetical protein